METSVIVILTPNISTEKLQAIPSAKRIIFVTKPNMNISMDFLNAMSGKTFNTFEVPNPENTENIVFAFGRIVQAAIEYYKNTNVITTFEFFEDTPKDIVRTLSKFIPKELLGEDTAKAPVKKAKKAAKPAEKTEKKETSVKTAPAATDDKPVEKKVEKTEEKKVEKPEEKKVEKTAEEKLAMNPPTTAPAVPNQTAPVQQPAPTAPTIPNQTAPAVSKDLGLLASEIIKTASVDAKYAEGIATVLSKVTDVGTLKTYLQLELSRKNVTSEDLDKIYNTIVDMGALNK